MTVTRQSLAEQYRLFTDSELVEVVRSPEMTPLAREVAGGELAARGLAVEVTGTPNPEGDERATTAATVSATSEEPAFRPEDASEPGADDLVQIARHLKAVEAEILRGRLEAEGLLAIVADANLAQVNPILAPVIGGVRVLVRAADLARAQEIMSAVARGDYALDDGRDVGAS